MTIRNKLAGSVILTALAILAITAIGFYATYQVNSKVELLTEKSTPAQVKIMELQQLVKEIFADFMLIGLADDNDETKEISKEIEERIVELSGLIKELRRLEVDVVEEDPAGFRRLHTRVLAATAQRLSSAETFRTEISLVNKSLRRSNEIIGELTARVGRIRQDADRQLLNAQNASTNLNGTIKNLLTMQNRLKEFELLFKELLVVKNKYYLAPLAEKIRALADSIRHLGTVAEDQKLISELKLAAAKVFERVLNGQVGFIKLRADILSGAVEEGEAYRAEKEELELEIARLGVRMLDAIDPLELHILKDKRQMDKALGFRETMEKISALATAITIDAKDLGGNARLIMLTEDEASLNRTLDETSEIQTRSLADIEGLNELLRQVEQPKLRELMPKLQDSINSAEGAVNRIADARSRALIAEGVMQDALATLKSASQEQSRNASRQVRQILLRQQEAVAQVDRTVNTSMAQMALISFLIIAFILVANGMVAGSVTNLSEHLEQANEKLHHLAERDALTGVFNRRLMDEQLDAEIARSERYGHELALIMLDLDHFKQLNDQFGHNVGDRVLIRFADTVCSQVRSSDRFYRYGGEEFLLLLPETVIAETLVVAEKIRETVEILHLSSSQEPLPATTVSLGVACYPQHGTESQQLINAADQALYRAKSLGRNRVVVAESGSEPGERQDLG